MRPIPRHSRRWTACADAGFPVENVDIVGLDLRLVERVAGRLSKRGRAAMYGAGIGAWWGLFFGLLVGLLPPPVPSRSGSCSADS